MAVQRYRDQIKAWLAGNEVKDKQPLQDARRQIETLMETFKVVERETKTKAYSKEGLTQQQQKQDPAERERLMNTDWCRDRVAALRQTIERVDLDIERLIQVLSFSLYTVLSIEYVLVSSESSCTLVH